MLKTGPGGNKRERLRTSVAKTFAQITLELYFVPGLFLPHTIEMDEQYIGLFRKYYQKKLRFDF